MKKTIPFQDLVFQYLQRPHAQQLRTDIQADVAVIGGGMAGLSAAQAFLETGKKVALLSYGREPHLCYIRQYCRGTLQPKRHVCKEKNRVYYSLICNLISLSARSLKFVIFARPD